MRFIDRYFYAPSFWQKVLSFTLLPISLLYLLTATLRRKFGRYYDFGIPIISIGNLVAGGSGKTPFIQEIAKDFESVAIVSRGFKRKSKGLLVVSHNGKILCNELESGDEAFMLAQKLKNASVIVCKDRRKAILKAKELGAKCVFLDDGFRFNFKKLNIVLVPKLEPYFKFTIPSGLYRENPHSIKNADIIAKEGIDYKRSVEIVCPSERMLLLTAIANPSRLDEFLPKNVVGKITLNDHSRFDLEAIGRRFRELNATSLLITQKDEVKLQDCNLPLSVMCLKLDISTKIREKIVEYISQ